MLLTDEKKCPITPDLQCWLLTACCALAPKHDGAFPELGALRRAIRERHQSVIAMGFEVVCSHLKTHLSRRQLRLTEALANGVRSGDVSSIRPTVVELCRA